MNKHTTGIKRIARITLICMLTLCMLAGTIIIGGPAVAASEFSYSSPFSNTGKSTYYHNGKFTGNLIVNGVDISDWQSKKCNFKTAKANGVDYAIMRVTYTNTSRFKDFRTNIDENFSYQYKNAVKNGVMTGVYVFSQAKTKNEAISEATYAVKRLKALGIGPEDLNLPVYMDYEFSGGVLGRLYGLSKTDATNAASAFCNTIKSYGYQPGIYASTTFYNNYIDTSKLASDVDIWCAQYYNRCEYGGNYSKWQYSSSAKIGGMLYYTGWQGNIDADFWYINRKAPLSSLTKVYGKTVLSVQDAKHPTFKIYNGKTLLREGVDYNVGGIRNNSKGRGYAYIKGIGRYSGYALVPITIKAKTVGSDKDLSKVTANYLKYATSEKSQYVKEAEALSYKKGSSYTVQTELNIRKGPGVNYGRVSRSSLSSTMKKKTCDGIYSVLKPGAKVKCKKVKGDWMKISGGWICCREGDDIYVK